MLHFGVEIADQRIPKIGQSEVSRHEISLEAADYDHIVKGTQGATARRTASIRSDRR